MATMIPETLRTQSDFKPVPSVNSSEPKYSGNTLVASRGLPLVAGIWLGLFGCSNHTSVNQATEVDFETVFEQTATVRLEEPPGLPIARISGVDVDTHDRIVLADPSEGSIKLFDRTGHLLRVLGQRGAGGPGEFNLPLSPKFDHAGRIHVLDARLSKISVFSPSGELQREMRLDGVPKPASMALINNNEYVLSAPRAGADAEVVFYVDSSGKMMRSFLKLGAVRPAGEPDSPLWNALRRPTVAVSNGTIYAATSLVDSVWSISLKDGKARGIHVPIPQYRPPRLMRVNPRDEKAVIEWARSQTTAATVFAGENVIALPFVTGGLYHEGAANVLLIRRGTSWVAVRDAPPIIGMTASGSLVSILSSPGLPSAHKEQALTESGPPYILGILKLR